MLICRLSLRLFGHLRTERRRRGIVRLGGAELHTGLRSVSLYLAISFLFAFLPVAAYRYTIPTCSAPTVELQNNSEMVMLITIILTYRTDV
jgi:hypothetical protein